MWAKQAGAGWHPDAWPSDAHYRTTTTTVATVENVYARYHREIWTQTSGPTNIHEVQSSDLTGFPTHLGPISAVATNYRVWTNEFLTDVQVNVPTQTVASWGPTNLYYTNVSVVASNAVTNRMHWYTEGVQTNLNLNVRDLWAWDSYMACLERWHAVSGLHECGVDCAYLDRLSLLIGPTKPKFYHTDNRLACVAAKYFLKNGTGAYLDRDLIDTVNLKYDGSSSLLAWTNALAKVSAPTNYGDYTPYRNLGGGSPGDTMLQTGTWHFSSAGTSTVQDACGNAIEIVHTNGQITTFVCTNASIAADKTSADYGWKYIPAICALYDTVLQNNTADESNNTISVNQCVRWGNAMTYWYGGLSGTNYEAKHTGSGCTDTYEFSVTNDYNRTYSLWIVQWLGFDYLSSP